MKPQRVQRLRKKGFKLQDASKSGLPVKYVGRPTVWGNPFRLTQDGFVDCYSTQRGLLNPWIMWSISNGFTQKHIVQLYKKWLKGEFKNKAYLPIPPKIEQLRGYDLACFCTPGQPCHVDVLLEQLEQT